MDSAVGKSEKDVTLELEASPEKEWLKRIVYCMSEGGTETRFPMNRSSGRKSRSLIIRISLPPGSRNLTPFLWQPIRCFWYVI
jgi:hypothetical protein